MASVRYAVVFDTNSYRNIVLHRAPEKIKEFIKQIKQKEHAKNIAASGTSIVGMEMLAHLAGPGKSLHYDGCLRGLIAMANHCCDDFSDTMRMISPSYLQITQLFFDVIPPDAASRHKGMAGVIGDFKDRYLAAIEGHQLKGTFIELERYIAEEEEIWVEEVLRLIEGPRLEILEKYPSHDAKYQRAKLLEYIDSGHFVPFVAMALIFAVARSLKISMTEQEHVMKGYELPFLFPLSVGFYQWICHRIVADNIDMLNKRSRESRWNWRWDYEISFLINDNIIDNRQLFLVTADRDLRNMLRQFGYSGRVMDLKEYLAFLDE